MTPELLTAIAVAFVGGTAIPEILRMLKGLLTSSTSNRRNEVDRMAGLVTSAEARAKLESDRADHEATLRRAADVRADRAYRERRLALEVLSRTRRAAFDFGMTELPEVDLGG